MILAASTFASLTGIVPLQDNDELEGYADRWSSISANLSQSISR